MIKDNIARCGNFTSSEIVALTALAKNGKDFGAPALTYIAETNMERRLGRSLTDESFARPLVWGKLLEPRVHNILPIDYIHIGTETIVHPEYAFWCGSPDGKRHNKDTVTDTKAPSTLKSFCQLVDPLYDGLEGMDAMNAIRFGYVDKNGLAHAAHKDGNKFFYQLVSNSILAKTKYAELIVYMPYESELEEIKSEAEGDKHCYWIWAADKDELPHLKDNGFYKNINIIRFEVPIEDKNYLTDCVVRASELLNHVPSIIIASHDKEVGAVIINN